MEKGRQTKWIRWSLTILFGMSLTLVRSVMPMHVDITTGIVILEGVLELCIGIAVVWLNRKELKEFFENKFRLKDYGIILLLYVILMAVNFFFSNLEFFPQSNSVDAAAIVGSKFQEVFPLGVIITTCIIAPITEETVFRLTLKNMIQNKILFVLISCILFGFIHTAAFNASIITYCFIGIAFSISYLITKDIRKVMLAHILVNITANVIGFLLAGQ